MSSPSLDSIVDRMDFIEDSAKPFPFFHLPAELRTAIYEELLVSDASFRLGHHGPFCLVERKQTWPAILRVSRKTHLEASPILYGANSFFLGTIGFKPIYSFSFHASIGSHNAALIRKLVVHSTYPHLLTQKNIKRWIDSLGIDFDTLKVLAVSFEACPVDVAPMPPQTWPTAQLLPPVPAATLQSMGNAIPTTPAVTTATVTVTTTTTWQTVNPPPGQHVPTQQQWTQIASAATQTTTILPSAAAAGGMVTAQTYTAGSHGFRLMTKDAHYEKCAKREKLWLKKATTEHVQEFANTNNCDLRAGEHWLMYRDPSVRKLPRSRWMSGWGVVDLG